MIAALVLVLTLFAMPLAAEAQQAGRAHRLGILRQTVPDPPNPRSSVGLLITALRELGYVEGQNLGVEYRHANDRVERLPALARELVHLKMDAIVPVGPYRSARLGMRRQRF